MSSHESRIDAVRALHSPAVIRAAMVEGPTSELANSRIHQVLQTGLASGASDARGVFWQCHRWLSKNYRNDIFYRKVAVSYLSSHGQRSLFPEFRADRSIVDLLAVTKSLHAVEIKSDRDNASRLGDQLLDYMKIAPQVSLFGPRRMIRELRLETVFESVGLHWVDDKGQVRCERPAEVNTRFLDSTVLMRSLRREEYTKVLLDLGLPVPRLPNTRIFSYALEESRKVDPLAYHNAVSAQLRKRRLRAGNAVIERMPAPLIPSLLRLDPTINEVARLRAWLTREISHVHAKTEGKAARDFRRDQLCRASEE